MSGKNSGGKSGQVMRFIFTILILILFMGGTLLGLYLYMDYLLELSEREGFSEEDLVAPLDEASPLETETAPVFILPWEPGLTTLLKLNIAVNDSDGVNKLDGIRGIGIVLNLSIINIGSSRIYVERLYARPGWGGEISGEVKKYVEVDGERYMRHMLVPIPEPVPEPEESKLTILFDVLVERGRTWYRREGVYWEYPVNVLEMRNTTASFELKKNPPYFYDKVNDLVKEDRVLVRSMVENDTRLSGDYTVQSIVEAFLFVRSSLEYIPDPDNGRNEWISPMTCLLEGGGDCEDFSILLGSIITAMGGNSRIIITSGHAFNAVYIGENESVLDRINERFGLEIPLLIWEDELGKWLIIEPQSWLVFGWFPLDVEPIQGAADGRYIYGYDEMSWGFVDSDEISVVDIYLK
ncbi:MAG: hypothetical protein ACMUHM_09560 [Thermoplasmatota archaeon]